MKKSFVKEKRALTLTLAVGAATIAASAPSTAQAAIDPVAIKQYVDLANSIVKLGKEILGGSGADLEAQLRTFQAAIIGEIRSQRNLALRSEANSVFNLFRNLADNEVDDPVNSSFWSEIILKQQTTADAMADIINTTGDAASASELSSAYATLIATGTDVLRLKGDLDPKHPSSWADFFNWTQPGINTQYAMIKSQYHQCYPGSNPGYRPPPSGTKPWDSWLPTVKPGKYRDSLLWKSYENRWIRVQTVSAQCRNSTVIANIQCNPATKSCIGYPTSCSGTTVTWNACSGLTALACAEKLATPDFNARPQVKVLRDSMKALQTLSGGNDFDSAKKNNPLMAQGKFTDPFVDETSCGSTWPWAYAQLP